MRLTNFLTKKLAKINSKILEFETDKKHYSLEDVVNAIKPKPIPALKPVAKLPLFKDVADNHLREHTYPFGGREKIMIKFGKTEKIGLTADEINQLKQYQLRHNKHICTIAAIYGRDRLLVINQVNRMIVKQFPYLLFSILVVHLWYR
jgi:hypothetical protein